MVKIWVRTSGGASRSRTISSEANSGPSISPATANRISVDQRPGITASRANGTAKPNRLTSTTDSGRHRRIGNFA
jgi:hypothetical protein